ncbi:Signal recognition particle subunit SRP72 [Gracilariopsis chorda]|uniref:Signal recognition particle subunit SRP72 n=1 Tax=Gracilariopsis chorda TaxID=448386 RepID=A0A2V3ILL2_9FLOR|nr:Signal recognition particle subunit SRP72 [Gracilariopsis chorda]|eukprot:PXF42937.1 Signal recognition particle subunit SRP72 [Gracilariopsis chorda]
MTATELSLSAVDELRQLFNRGQYEALLTRVNQFRKRNKKISPSLDHALEAARAFALIYLGKSEQALPSIEALLKLKNPPFKEQISYARAYAAWASNERVTEAIDVVSDFTGADADKLRSQLLYRAGRYGEAAELYGRLLQEARDALKEKKHPTATSRWRFAGLGSRSAQVTPPVTAVEVEQLTSAVNELATNAMASFILAGDYQELPAIQEGLRQSYEVQYNAACKHIAVHDFESAETSLETADALINSELDEEVDDVEEATSPLFVQQAYLRHMAGDIESAKQSYYQIITGRRCDAATLAVAANNFTVAIGQLALGKSGLSITQDGTRALSKQQHEALVEGLKKMKATASRNVMRKLTSKQRQAMARNRAVLYVQIGRLDSCRSEIEMLKVHYPDDVLVFLVEASLLAKQGKLEAADNILSQAADTQVVRAARVQLAAAYDNKDGAAQLLQTLFPDEPAAVCTAASFLEQCGKVEEGFSLLRRLVSRSSGQLKEKANRELAAMLLRNGRYKESAAILRHCTSTAKKDMLSTAQLVVATSHFDPDDADRIASVLHDTGSSAVEQDAEKLEGLPPPKRKHMANRIPDIGENNQYRALDASSSHGKKKSKKKKKRLPKNYNPNGPPPDPERWLPKTLRSGYKKKKQKRDQVSFRGSQGADAASAEEAAQKMAEKPDSKAAQQHPLPPRARPRLQRRKKAKK